MKTINLSRGKIALVDDEDYKLLSKFKWYANGGPNFYAVREAWKNGKRTRVLLTDVILKLPADKGVQYINCNSLDCRKHNLIICDKNSKSTIKKQFLNQTGIYRKIPLTKGKFAIVDMKYYESLIKYNWAAIKVRGGGWYAIRCSDHKTTRKYFNMINFVKKLPPGHSFLFKNKNSLDLRSKNLKIIYGTRLARAKRQIIRTKHYTKIELTRGKFAFVDNEDYKKVSKYNWHFHAGDTRRSYYAVRGRGGKRLTMHHLILKVPAGMYPDHINHNGLDNRKSNLRLVTFSQNSYNRRKRRGKSSSIYKGVSWVKSANRYKAAITYQKHKFHLGMFKNEKEAALAYNKAAAFYFKKHAWLNTIPE